MASAYQPQARLVCVAFLTTCLVGALAVQPLTEASSPSLRAGVGSNDDVAASVAPFDAADFQVMGTSDEDSVPAATSETVLVADVVNLDAPSVPEMAAASALAETVAPDASGTEDDPAETEDEELEAAARESVPSPGDAAPPDAGPQRLYRVCRVTAYCDQGTTAAGVPSGVGQCAAPGYIPLGSKVYIPALGKTFVVTDRTHRRFRNSTVDIFIPSKQQCRQFGRRFLDCEFTLPEGEGAAGSRASG